MALVYVSSGIRTIIRFSSLRLATGAYSGCPFLPWCVPIIPLLAACAYITLPLITSSYFPSFSAASFILLAAASTRSDAFITRS